MFPKIPLGLFLFSSAYLLITLIFGYGDSFKFGAHRTRAGLHDVAQKGKHAATSIHNATQYGSRGQGDDGDHDSEQSEKIQRLELKVSELEAQVEAARNYGENQASSRNSDYDQAGNGGSESSSDSMTGRVQSAVNTTKESASSAADKLKSAVTWSEEASDPVALHIREHWMRQANDALWLLASPCPFAAFGSVVVDHNGANGGLGELVCMGVNSAIKKGNPTLHGKSKFHPSRLLNER